MPLRLAIFDFDGTLADSFPWFRAELNGFARRHGFREIEPHETETLRSKTTREILASLRVPLWKVPAIARDMRRHKAEAGIRLFADVPDALRALAARNIILAMVSSDSEASIRNVLGAEIAGLFTYFDCGASLFGKPKKIRSVLRISGIAPDETIYVGDETRDAEAARAAGIRFAAALWGYASREALIDCAPDIALKTPSEIAGLA